MKRVARVVFFIIILTYQAKSQVSYCKIAPIIANKCEGCHNGENYAPFNFSSFDAVKKNATLIKQVINTGYMPPWPANNSYVSFKHNKSLTIKEMNLLLDWFDGGMKNCKVKPEKKKQINTKERPDIVMGIKDPFTIMPLTNDQFVYFLLNDSLIKEPLNITKFIFKPGNKSVVHHIELASVVINNKSNLTKVGNNVICMQTDKYGERGYFFDIYDYVAGWLPGQSEEMYPTGFIKQIPKDRQLVLMVHYGPTPIECIDSTKVEFFINNDTTAKVITTISINGASDIPGGFYLPANKVTTLTTSQTIYSSFKIYSILAHMHHLAKNVEAYAITPDSKKINLLKIDCWQFNWQYEYQYEIPTIIPANSTVYFNVTYDNTKANLLNPYILPKPILFSGMKSTDEMLNLFLHYTDYKEGDEVAENW